MQILLFFVIWGLMIGSSYFIGQAFGTIWGVLFFLYGSGLVGALGALIVVKIAAFLGIDVD